MGASRAYLLVDGGKGRCGLKESGARYSQPYTAPERSHPPALNRQIIPYEEPFASIEKRGKKRRSPSGRRLKSLRDTQRRGPSATSSHRTVSSNRSERRSERRFTLLIDKHPTRGHLPEDKNHRILQARLQPSCQPLRDGPSTERCEASRPTEHLLGSWKTAGWHPARSARRKTGSIRKDLSQNRTTACRSTGTLRTSCGTARLGLPNRPASACR